MVSRKFFSGIIFALLPDKYFLVKADFGKILTKSSGKNARFSSVRLLSGRTNTSQITSVFENVDASDAQNSWLAGWLPWLLAGLAGSIILPGY